MDPLIKRLNYRCHVGKEKITFTFFIKGIMLWAVYFSIKSKIIRFASGNFVNIK